MTATVARRPIAEPATEEMSSQPRSLKFARRCLDLLVPAHQVQSPDSESEERARSNTFSTSDPALCMPPADLALGRHGFGLHGVLCHLVGGIDAKEGGLVAGDCARTSTRLHLSVYSVPRTHD
jgi:hypothetical protein